MKIYTGKPVFRGIAIGPVQVYRKEKQAVKRNKIEDAAAEWKRVEEAKLIAREQLQGLYDKARKEVGEANAAIFEVHQMMLEDLDYLDSIQNMISLQMVNAEYAVAVTADNFSQMFASMDDDYMKERAADVRDVSERLIAVLNGASSGGVASEVPSVICADDLAPSETVQMDKSMILAFVTRFGSTNSHTAILARTMNIPALIGVDVDLDTLEGMMCIVDGFTGEFIVEPDEETLTAKQVRQAEEEEKRKLLLELKGQETVTKSGKKIKLYANIGGVGDVASVLANDAAGIGLFRSEFLYLENEDYPTEDEQFQAYRTVAEMMSNKPVIIRTLDIGADKQIDYFNLEKEENPAMGYRAIRICLDRIDLFKTQLRAIFRASAFGNLQIMYPMIISVDEVLQIKEIVKEVKEELLRAGIPFGDVQQGIMIETPAAVMISDLLAKEVDFFSIGTNDLTQYTLAIDRQNPKLDPLYDPYHEGVLRMIELVMKNAHEAGIWAGICGELGADTVITERLIQMGVDELSVSPSMVLPVRKIIREIS